jgi:protein SCO1/2
MLVSSTIKSLNNESSEELIAARIDAARKDRRKAHKLVPLLDYGHIIYNGRSRNETIRIRGYLLAAFSDTGLPRLAIPYILDELESSKFPYIVAGAAMALRGLQQPYPELTDYLFKAVQNIRNADDAISFDTYKPQWPLQKHTSALAEIFTTFQWMGAYATHTLMRLKLLRDDLLFTAAVRSSIDKAIATISNSPTVTIDDCCGIQTGFYSYRKKINRQSLAEITLKDQDNQLTTYSSFFEGKPTLVLFFYTRCDNPNRCSLNITRMAQLQQALRTEGLYGKINIAAISYDPAYDLPMRTKPYCTNRGFVFDEHSKCFTVDKGMDILLSYLEPGVNYNGALLNHHTSELFLLDDKGRSSKRMPCIDWDANKIINEVRQLSSEKRKRRFSVKHALSSTASVLFSFLLIFFPKCPFCAAAYLSMFGISTYDFFRIKAWVLPSFIGLLLINLFALFWMGRKRKWYLPFYLSLAGAACILLAALSGEKSWVTYAGMILVIIGSLLNGLPASLQIKTRSFFSNITNGFYFQRNHFSDHKPFKL